MVALHWLSWLALALIVGALALGWSRRFLAFGALAMANVLIHFIGFLGPVKQVPGTEDIAPVMVADLGLWTHRIGEAEALVQWVGHMFLHGSFSHLFGNMLILLVIGFYLEERAGHRVVVLAYLLTGIVAAVTELTTHLGDTIVLIGASGADFGLIGVLAAAYPMDRLRIPVPVFIILFIQMRAWMAAIVFAALQFVFLSTLAGVSNTAYFAHLGGLGAGIVLGWTAFRHKRPEERQRARDLSAFATSRPAREAWAHIKGAHEEPAVQEAWSDRFLAAARCPRCGTQPERHRGGLRCPHCGFEGDEVP